MDCLFGCNPHSYEQTNEEHSSSGIFDDGVRRESPHKQADDQDDDWNECDQHVGRLITMEAKARPLFDFAPKKKIGSVDQTFWQRDCFVIGVDDVGRGSLSGPVTAGAVLLNPNLIPQGINDSKKLTPEKRQELFPQIVQQALAYQTVHIYPTKIAEIGIQKATIEAMKLAVVKLFVNNSSLLGDGITTVVLVDGEYLLPLGAGFTQRSIIRGDSKSVSIAAASILAKVTRDQYMTNAAKEFPVYGWKNNLGYGSRRHIQAIKKHGISPLHRRSFCEKWLNKN